MRPDDSLTVSIAHQPDDIAKAINRALTEIHLDDFKDQVVAIKPNDTSATPQDRTACTQADSLRATIRFIKNLHPKRVVVSGGSGDKATEEVFRTMGYMEVIAEEGVEFFDHNHSP